MLVSSLAVEIFVDLVVGGGVGSGGRIRTCDLRVMSPTSYHCSTPHRCFVFDVRFEDVIETDSAFSLDRC